MAGIALMIVGFLTFLGGFVIYKTSADAVPMKSESNLEPESEIIRTEHDLNVLNPEPETETIDANEENGYNFEKYIVQKFNKEFFTIKDWTSDKNIDGAYAESSTNPDLIVEFGLKGKNYPLSVECKWRRNMYKGGIEFAYPDQLKRYKEFERKRKMPVFLAVGIGGKSTAPEKLYIIPLREVYTTFLYKNQLAPFEKDVKSNMFYDFRKEVLR